MATCASCHAPRPPSQGLYCPACQAARRLARLATADGRAVARWKQRHAQRTQEFAALDGALRNKLQRAGYWSTAQCAAVPDDWLRATVRGLGAIGLRRLRALAPVEVR